MKQYRGTFIKKNGDEREMTFAYIEDLPADFLKTHIIGSGQDKVYPVGMKLVWDLEANNFRIFNFNATLEEPVLIE
jgi:hypothetical protein|tara:strand:- start:1645 stop:1872 length:228 start_codon:yes stop_codon:yes gene_type:complete